MRKRRMGLLAKLVLTVVVACAIFTVVLVRYETMLFVKSLRSQRMVDMEQALRAAGEYLDLRAQHIVQLTNTCSQMAELSEGTDEQISEALRQFVDTNIATVRSAYFVDTRERVYASRQVLYDVLVQTLRYDLPLRLARQVRTASSTVSSAPYRSSMFTDRTVAFMRAVHSAAGSRVGTVILEIDLSKLAEGFRDSAHLELYPFALFADRGGVVFENMLSEDWTEEELGRLADLPAGWSQSTGAAWKTYQAYAYACRNVRWKLTVLMDESQLLASVPQLMAHIVQASVISFALLALLVTFLSYSITRPIGKLARSMRSTRGNDATLPKPPQTRRRDEIGDLYGSFALMIGRIEALLRHQQETERARHAMELKVLQSQISPHFLYNSLNTLGSLATQGRAGEIPQTTAALIRLLAVSMDKTDEMIPLRQELDTLQSYLRIQRMRYGERFALSVLVPEELTDLYVPKLILQPLVENAVFHGFSDGRTDGLIVVEGRLGGSMLLLSVADNGVGMTPELARSILDEQSPEARRHHKGSLRSIGLRNTQDRIRLRFGDAYGLDVISQEGMGTMITVSLPPMTQADLAKDTDAPGNGLK